MNNKEYLKKYRQTEKYKQYMASFRSTESYKENHKKQNKMDREKDPEKTYLLERNRRLKNKYGITLEDWEKMFIWQNGCCAICKKEVKLYVDHNHKTGKVRGLLCHKCNVAFSFLDESIDIFNSMIEYAKRHE